MKIAITGASGFVGSHLRKKFPDHVVIDRKDDAYALAKKLGGVDAVINLAGAPIIKRWSDPYKKVLWESRIGTTNRIVRAIDKSDVKHFISTSAIGIYPDDTSCDESCTRLASDFLAKLAMEWEQQAIACSKPTAILRFGVVLGAEGGALAQMLQPFRFCVGGPIGKGNMMTSWIDIEDLMRVYDFVIGRRSEGTYNAVSPNPVSNHDLSSELSRLFGCPFMIPIPVFMIRLMYGEASRVLTSSKLVYPQRLIEEGFKFNYPLIKESLKHLVKGKIK